jgi:integrase
VSPTPAGLKQIEHWLRARNEEGVADLVCFLAYSGLRIGEALALDWEVVDWGQKMLHVKREKRGITPWVPILPEMETLLRDMQKRAKGHLLFASPFDPATPRDGSAVRHRMTAACRGLGLGQFAVSLLNGQWKLDPSDSGLLQRGYFRSQNKIKVAVAGSPVVGVTIPCGLATP